ncbi:MAG: XRE family transcriptional regulator [Bacteroidales bacterium]|nr:XRE family transcriptional regulator [Bacteroidales bacterium]
MQIHIGDLIREELMRKPKNYSVTWFAHQLNCDRRNVYSIFHRKNVDVELLMRISEILDHDFFKDLSNELGKDRNKKLEK